MAVAVEAMPCGNKFRFGIHSPWENSQLPPSSRYQPASITKYFTPEPFKRLAISTTRSCSGLPQVVHHSLASTGSDCSLDGACSTAAICMEVKRWHRSSKSPLAVDTYASGLEKDSPDATFFLQ